MIAVMLIGSVVGTKDDRGIWSSTSGHPRGDAVLHGWRFNYTVRERSARSGFRPDPDDPGMKCGSFKIGDVTGWDCSNVW